MHKLPQSHPWFHDHFMSKGYHTVRRSDRFWSGIWIDFSIGQIMMRTIKSRGGLTRGRGFTESVGILCGHSMYKCGSMHQTMSELIGLKQTANEQYVNMSRTRILMTCIQWYPGLSHMIHLSRVMPLHVQYLLALLPQLKMV